MDFYLDGVLLFQQEIYLLRFEEGKGHQIRIVGFIKCFCSTYMTWFQLGEPNKALKSLKT